MAELADALASGASSRKAVEVQVLLGALNKYQNMKILLFHCKKYKSKVTGLSTRPANLKPEPFKQQNNECKDCILSFITVEKKDAPAIISLAAKEIEKMAIETKRTTVMITPFAHLSHELAEYAEALKILNLIKTDLDKKFKVLIDHFGSHKELELNTYGHPGACRFREF